MKFTVDQRKRSTGFRWCVLRDFEVVAVVATYVQAFKIAALLNANAILDEERIAELQAVTIGESIRRRHAEAAIRARRFAA